MKCSTCFSFLSHIAYRLKWEKKANKIKLHYCMFVYNIKAVIICLKGTEIAIRPFLRCIM